MEQLRHIEMLVSILLASFELQIQSIRILHDHKMRAGLTQHSKQLVQVAAKAVEKIENQFIREIEKTAEQVLGQSASAIDALEKGKVYTTDAQTLRKISALVKEGHGELTTQLAEEEKKLVAEVRQRIAQLKKRINETLIRIGRM